jgi:hypothetical protein
VRVPRRESVPLVCTWLRCAACASAVAVAFVAAAAAYLGFMHSQRGLASLAVPLLVAVAVQAPIVYALLRAEESRLASELRTARTGTPVLRSMISRKRERAPLIGRLFVTRVGAAAVLLADGDRSGAVELLAARSALSLLMQGGRLDGVREIVNADLERATGTPDALDRCIERLSTPPGGTPVGNREADLYRTYVLVKAVLERGDTEKAVDLAAQYIESADEEERLYGTWLRAWFDLEKASPEVAWPEVDEGQLRMAALAARAHGAERLVELLEARLSAIARPERQG